MGANKIAAIVSLILDIIIGGMMMWANVPKIIYDMLMGIFTGLVVSFVASMIGYYVERTKIKSKLQTVIPDTYLNLTIVHSITGSILPQIIYTEKLSKLNYDNVITIVDIALKGIGKEYLNTYSGFLKFGKLHDTVFKMKKFEAKVFNLKNCLNNILKNALSAENLQLEKQMTMHGALFAPEKEKLIMDTRNCVNIQTAKVHEYEASLMNEVEDIAIMFLGQKRWEEQKRYIFGQTKEILNDVR